jgi:hypothetical protein
MWFGWVVSGDGWAAEGVDMGTGFGMSVLAVTGGRESRLGSGKRFVRSFWLGVGRKRRLTKVGGRLLGFALRFWELLSCFSLVCCFRL